MRIGDLAVATGVSPRLLRYYEEQGLLSPGRDGSGYRVYPPEAPTAVRQIRALLRAGLTTGVIRTVLPCAAGAPPELEPCPELVATLRREVGRLDRRIDALSESRTLLEGYLAGAGEPDHPAASA